ncbi:MAG: hypothetical protein H7143_06285 [Pseudorhodobacter sp.]|nr:hypothetical protein [Rhizobacter sp.]
MRQDVAAPLLSALSTLRVQQVIEVRRDYNHWAARESMEDCALRFQARQAVQARNALDAFGHATMAIHFNSDADVAFCRPRC